MLIKTKPTPLFQIFCKIIFNLEIIAKSIIGPDNIFRGSLKHYWVNPLMLRTTKTALQFLRNIAGKSIFGKLFDEEMFIKTLLTTLLQIFRKIILNSKIAVKSIRDPDNNFWRNP